MDIIIIGGGPAGYAAALKLSGHGHRISLIEEEKVGGTCLNIGCIPTKALLYQAKFYRSILEAAGKTLEIKGTVEADWPGIQEYKNSIIQKLVQGVEYLLKKSGVNFIPGRAEIASPGLVRVGGATFRYDKLLIASGSKNYVPPIEGACECKAVIDSTGALALDAIPKRLAIIGGGVIGVEFATIYRQLGAEVAVFEAMDRLIPNFDPDLSSALRKSLEDSGVVVHTDAVVLSIEDLEGGSRLLAESAGKSLEYMADKILVSVGRRANFSGLGLEQLRLKTDKKGISVNEYMQTSDQNVYAIGDVTGKMMLAHAAYSMAEVAADHILGGRLKYSEKAVPSCVYTDLEIASVGLTEEEAKKRNVDVQVIMSPLSGNGMSLVETGGKGFVKLIVGPKYCQLVGLQLAGESASEIIAQGVQAIMSEQTAEEFLSFVYPHPSVSEAVREAALESIGEAIHQVRK